MDAKKPWWKSKTLAWNLLVGVLAVVEAHSALAAQLFSPAVYPWFALGVAWINVILRVITTSSLTSGE